MKASTTGRMISIMALVLVISPGASSKQAKPGFVVLKRRTIPTLNGTWPDTTN
jgi:hypothetical protein